MPKINAKDILIPTVALVLICGVSTALLATTNEITKEPISQAEAQTKQTSMNSVSPDGTVEYEPVSIDDSSAECYRAKDASGKVIAYAVSTSAKGYGGTIKIMTGFDVKGNIIGVNVYDNSTETPGLGAKTSEDVFSDQFKDRSSENGFTVAKDADKNPGKDPVDAVTGATISSRAVVKAVNQAVEIFNQVSGGAE